MDLRTPLNRVRGLGSAKEGTDHFWRQRLTAVANIPLVIFFVWLLVSLNGAGYAETLATLQSPFVVICLLLVMLSVLTHMRLGMQVIIEDYIHGEGLKIILLMANTFFVVFLGVISVFALLKLGFETIF